MSKVSISQLAGKLYELLEPLSSDERARVVKATFVLFGDESPALGGAGAANAGGGSGSGGSNNSSAAAYMLAKQPKNKGEELAVAARYRENQEGAESHSKEDLKRVFTLARRNFDAHNFDRDMNNAKRQSGFFNLTTPHALSYFGQQFVDALPDREAIKKLHRPRVGGSGKKKSKEKSPKKKS